MTITEATAVNVLLRWITGQDPVRFGAPRVPTSGDALKAAQVLADKADKALSAGWRPEQLPGVWPTDIARSSRGQ